MVQLNFTPSEIERESRGLIPPGWYSACIVETNWVDTRAGDGKYLAITFQIDGDHHSEIGNRRVWDNLNLINPNETAVQIAERDLAEICDATSIGDMTDTEQLHGIPLAIKISTEAAKGDWPEKSVVSGYDASTSRFKPGAKPKPKPKPTQGKNEPAAEEPEEDGSEGEKPAWMQ